jgi:cell division protein FtsN
MNLIRSSGSALIGFICGLVVGLAIAVAAALYITRAPAPLVNKVKPPTESVNPAAGGELPDPNKPLYATPHAAQPGADAPVPQGAASPAPSPAGAKSPLAVVAPGLPATAPGAAADKPADGAIPETTRYVLQAGAYRSPDDADAIRARLALLGMDAKVVPRDQDGVTLYRVRLGPYGRVEDLDKIRQMLATNGIEAQVVTLK